MTMTCILCAGARFAEVAAKLRHDVQRRVVRCESCGLVSLEDPTTDVVDYSGGAYRKAHGPVVGKESSPREMFDISMPFQAARVGRVERFLAPNAAVLEIGSSTGHFLHTIKPRVRRTVGVELSAAHAAFAREHCGLEIYEKPLDQLPDLGERFDLIVMFQVLEHIAEPLRLLDLVRRFLAPGGVLHVEVPNIDDVLVSTFDLPTFRSFYYRAPHVYYYGAGTLNRLMAKAGLSGAISYAQTYSLFNHVHWLQTGQPQRDQTLAARSPEIRTATAAHAHHAAAIQDWFEELDAAYRARLIRDGLAELVCFTGTSDGARS